MIAMCELHQPQPAQARVSILADDDVIMHRNPEGRGDVHDLSRHLDVSRGRCWVAGRVIVQLSCTSFKPLNILRNLYARPELVPPTGACFPCPIAIITASRLAAR
jgi:hypothetical protein